MSSTRSGTSDTVPTGSSRGPNGQFLSGNRAAMGNPLARKAQQLRAGLLRAVSTKDWREVVKKLVDQAKAGDIQAAKLVIERCLGPAVAVDLVERLERLEAAVILTGGQHDRV